MEIDRREFIVVPGAAMAGPLFAATAAVPWHRKIRRLGQFNMTEADPVETQRRRVGRLLGEPEGRCR